MGLNEKVTGFVSFALTEPVTAKAPACAGVAVTLIACIAGSPGEPVVAAGRLPILQIMLGGDGLQPGPETALRAVPAGNSTCSMTPVAAEGPSFLTTKT